MQRIAPLGFLLFLLISCAPTPVASTATPVSTATPSPLPASPTPVPPSATPVPTLSLPLTPTISPNDRAAFVSETYVDYTILKPGERFTKSWKLKNSGTSTWNESYFLYREAALQNEPLTAVERLPLAKTVAPGETAEFAVEMIAPEKVGIYTVNWSLRNAQGEIVPVDGSRFIWVTIRVCDGAQSCPEIPSAGSAANGVSARLVAFTPQPQRAVAAFCMTLPGPNYAPSPASVTLLLDGVSYPYSTGGTTSPGCFEFEFPVAIEKVQAAQSVAISIAQVRILGGPNDPEGACQAAHAALTARYPGLDFTCQFSMAGYYPNLKLPPGMSREQADALIVDAIEGAIYGPWQLTVR
jgi:hypothetical protein